RARRSRLGSGCDAGRDGRSNGSSAMRAPIVSFLQGMAIGAANVIPGVSGGTMALVFGIYDRILGAVGRWGPKSAVDLLRALRSSERGTSLRAFAHRYE